MITNHNREKKKKKELPKDTEYLWKYHFII